MSAITETLIEILQLEQAKAALLFDPLTGLLVAQSGFCTPETLLLIQSKLSTLPPTATFKQNASSSIEISVKTMNGLSLVLVK